MDPLSIVSSIAGIAAVSWQVAQSLDALRSRFQNAHVTITALSSQCRTIRTGLAEMQKLVVQNRTIRERMDVVVALDTSLTGCMVVLSCLDSTVDKLHSGETTTASSSSSSKRSLIARWRSRASIVWNEAEMRGYLSMLQGQQSAVAFLVQLLQMESIEEILERVKSSKDFLNKQATDAASLRRANPQLHLADSVLEPKRGADTIFGRAGSVIGDQDFDFDNIIVNSRAYRRTLKMAEAAVSGRGSATPTNAAGSSQSPRPLMSLPNTSIATSQQMFVADRPDSTKAAAEIVDRQSLQADALGESPNPKVDGQEALSEILKLEREQHEATKDQLRELQSSVLNSSVSHSKSFLTTHDVDYFDHRCQKLCLSIQKWVRMFSKTSDMRASRVTSEINDEKIVDRLDNTLLDGSDVDAYLSDRVKRRDVFTSLVGTMIWEFIFTRYLFGLDREQRQKLKSLEKIFSHAPPGVVREWRATTLTLLSTRSMFRDQCNSDAEAVAQEILQTLTSVLPLPSNVGGDVHDRLRRVVGDAVELSILFRTQRSEYIMLPPLQPEYDTDGSLVKHVTFNAALMNECSGRGVLSNEDLEKRGATVQCVLFPLVVRKGDDQGDGNDEIVVTQAQVLVQDVAFRQDDASLDNDT